MAASTMTKRRAIWINFVFKFNMFVGFETANLRK